MNSEKQFPRVVAHRGYSKACPENTLPAFGAAAAMGADEIELDVKLTADNQLVIMHDASIDRVTDRTGLIAEMDWAEIAQADAGIKFDERWRGVRVPRLEEVWDVLAGVIDFNVHFWDREKDDLLLREITRLVEHYDIADQVCYALMEPDLLEFALEYAPHIDRCTLDGSVSWEAAEIGLRHRCQRVNLAYTYCTPENVERIHQAGMKAQVFYTDDPLEAQRYVDMGTDYVLTDALAEVLPVFQRALRFEEK